MKSKLSLVLLLFLLLPLLMYANSILVIQNHSVLEAQDPTLTISPTKDAYVSDIYPEDETGYRPWLWIANNMTYLQTYESFVHFDLPSNYSFYTAIEFQFHAFLTYDFIVQVDFYRITENWGEYSINWNNKPILGEYLFTLALSHDKNYKIDIRKYLTSNEFSICITGSYSQNNMVKLPSRENDWYESNVFPVIKLIEFALFDIIFIANIILISVVGVISIVNGGYFLYKRWNRIKLGKNQEINIKKL